MLSAGMAFVPPSGRWFGVPPTPGSLALRARSPGVIIVQPYGLRGAPCIFTMKKQLSRGKFLRTPVLGRQKTGLKTGEENGNQRKKRILFPGNPRRRQKKNQTIIAKHCHRAWRIKRTAWLLTD